MINAGFGKDKITDFVAGLVAGHDVISFSSSVFRSFEEVLGRTSQVGTNVVITGQSNDTFTLQSVQKSALVSGDFIFV